MLTGRQIREARLLLRWSRIRFSGCTSLPQTFGPAIESSDGPAWLTDEQEVAIRRALEGAGITFGIDVEGQPNALLSKGET